MKKILSLILLAGFITTCEVNLQKDRPIDSAMINKMVYLNENLSHGLGTMREHSEELLTKVKKVVGQKGNPPEGLILVKKAEGLKRISASVLGQFMRIQNDLFNNIGGGSFNKIEKGQIERPAETRGIFEMMIGYKKEGVGYQMQKELDKYVDYLNENFGGADQEIYNSPRLKNFEILTEDYKNDYVAQKKNTTQKTDFAYYHFANVSVIEALVALKSKQIEVVKYEIKCLEKMNSLAEQLPQAIIVR